MELGAGHIKCKMAKEKAALLVSNWKFDYACNCRQTETADSEHERRGKNEQHITINSIISLCIFSLGFWHQLNGLLLLSLLFNSNKTQSTRQQQQRRYPKRSNNTIKQNSRQHSIPRRTPQFLLLQPIYFHSTRTTWSILIYCKFNRSEWGKFKLVKVCDV